MKSLISSLNGVIPESDRVSPSYPGSAFRRFVVDFLYSLLTKVDHKQNRTKNKQTKKKHSFLLTM